MTFTTLFIYGTLKRGESNHPLIQSQHFLQPAITKAQYRIIDLGRIPGLIEDFENGCSVCGELWQVHDTMLQKLDTFEGVPSLYRRSKIELLDYTEVVEAYFWNREVPDGRPSGAIWPLPNSTDSHSDRL